MRRNDFSPAARALARRVLAVFAPDGRLYQRGHMELDFKANLPRGPSLAARRALLSGACVKALTLPGGAELLWHHDGEHDALSWTIVAPGSALQWNIAEPIDALVADAFVLATVQAELAFAAGLCGSPPIAPLDPSAVRTEERRFEIAPTGFAPESLRAFDDGRPCFLHRRPDDSVLAHCYCPNSEAGAWVLIPRGVSPDLAVWRLLVPIDAAQFQREMHVRALQLAAGDVVTARM